MFILLMFSIKGKTQSDYYNENHLRYDDFIYVDNLATVQILKPNSDIILPAIQLNTDEQLLLSFDDLNSGSGSYGYRVILCNQDWTPSDLMPMEYINGMTEIYFSESKLSYNTTKKYSHYEVLFPANEMKLTLSGNYLLLIFQEDNPEKPLITKRFYIYENQNIINASVSISKSPQTRLTHQELMIEIDKQNYNISDVYNNLTIKIQQNERKDNQIVLSKPKSVESDIIKYSYINDIVFEAGNEFRKLDMRSFIVQSANMENIQYDSMGYHIYLLPDAIRAEQKYINYQDINGKFRVINWDNPHLSEAIESDYAYVHFSLPVKRYNAEGEFYIMGEFTNWRFDSKYKLKYNTQKNRYEITLPLKQAYYDYQYIFLPNNKQLAENQKIEGNYSDTENIYHIFVYYRDDGDLNYKLICLKTISSRN